MIHQGNSTCSVARGGGTVNVPEEKKVAKCVNSQRCLSHDQGRASEADRETRWRSGDIICHISDGY